jgi:hypothetical protein
VPVAPTIADLLQVTRDSIADPRRYFQQEATGRGDTRVYRLNVPTVDPSDLIVTVNGEPTTEFQVLSEDGYIRFTGSTPPAEGDVIFIEGFYWDWFSNVTLNRYLGYAIKNYRQAEGEERFEELLEEDEDFPQILAAAASVEALWAEVTKAAREIDTSSPEVSIPARQRYQQLMQLLEAKTAELRRMEAYSNVGRYKIEMFNLRRVSRTTGRLVPVYKPQEYDDYEFLPERVLPPIDEGA